MTKEFKEYLQNTKNEFVTAVHELNLSPAQRVPMENILIAFDQCRHKLEEAQLQQHGVMQAEGSDGAKGAAVASEGQGEANTCAGEHRSLLWINSDWKYFCLDCGKSGLSV